MITPDEAECIGNFIESMEKMTIKRIDWNKEESVEKAVYKRWANGYFTCWLCEKSILTKEEFSFYHVVPKSRGGKSYATNLMPAHKICNEIKADKMIRSSEEFFRLVEEKNKHRGVRQEIIESGVEILQYQPLSKDLIKNAIPEQ